LAFGLVESGSIHTLVVCQPKIDGLRLTWRRSRRGDKSNLSN